MNPKLVKHPLIFDYLKKYQENPESRIFAPLAEAYRKAGLINEAIEIAREGLKVHPHFVGGRVALARALFDRKDFEAVLIELTPIVQDVPDNIIAQRLIGESCLMLGKVTEALNAFKMLLFFAPQDQDLTKLVQELEIQSYQDGALVLNADLSKGDAFLEKNVTSALADDPGIHKEKWIRKVELLQDLLLRVSKYRSIA